ncbi:hypothetical protein [Pseudomonas putida]
MTHSLMKKKTQQVLLDFLEEEIDLAAHKILKLEDRQDRFAYGQLQVFMTFRRILSDTVAEDRIEKPAQRDDLDRGFLCALEQTLARLGFDQCDLSKIFVSHLNVRQKRRAVRLKDDAIANDADNSDTEAAVVMDNDFDHWPQN